jgi:heme-degrading monooxygenase HmoA
VTQPRSGTHPITTSNNGQSPADARTLAESERAWRPDTHPEGMLRAYAYWSADEREIIGVSFWASQQLCEAWRSSGSEARRREAMAVYVVGEQERFYRGRELHVPDH